MPHGVDRPRTADDLRAPLTADLEPRPDDAVRGEREPWPAPVDRPPRLDRSPRVGCAPRPACGLRADLLLLPLTIEPLTSSDHPGNRRAHHSPRGAAV
ncbi:hypothetical protein PSD17_40500 [Pseudonocardia sp. D17]|nr:hypothetical protein PSD17_40500 [Pseudonocardia sp. D17]